MSTPKIVQQPGGGTVNEDAVVGAARQIRIDTDRNEVRLHDGVTTGGHRLPNIDAITTLIQNYLNGVGTGILLFFNNFTDMANSTLIGPNYIAIVIDPSVGGDNGPFPIVRLCGWINGTPVAGDATAYASIAGGYWKVIGGNGYQPLGSLLVDANDFHSAGMYGVRSTCANLPEATAGALIIPSEFSVGGSLNTQIYIPYAGTTNTRFYMRTASGTWNAWSQPLDLPSTGLASFGGNKLANTTYNAVGSYLLAQSSSTIIAPGATAAGSTLTPAGFTSVPAVATAGGVRSGTWQAMGDHPAASGVTLWVRTI